MDFDEPDDFPNFDEVITVVRHLFTTAMTFTGAGNAQSSVEQFRAVIRNHLEACDLDPYKPDVLKALVIGSLITTHTQMQYGEVGVMTAIIPAAAINMINDPVSDEELVSFEDITNSLVRHIKRPSFIRRFLRGFFCFNQ
jgi:hypothetical protein